MNSSKELLNGEVTERKDPAYELFKEKFEKLTGICLNFYKEKQMKRRITTLIGRKGLTGFQPFMERLQSSPAELAEFIDYITINVTGFFRTPEQWKIFEEDALPVLPANGKGPLKIWSTACSTGEEAYSLAISLLRMKEVPDFRIIATDIDEKVLSAARKGFYTDKSIEDLPLQILDRFFIKTDGGWRAADELKARIEFSRLDLLKDVYPSDCDLIVCRNVLIYFTEEAKDMVYRNYHSSLKPGGYLFTGNTEQIIYYKKFGFKKVRNFLYQKPQSDD